MNNPALAFVLSLVEEGLHPSAVAIEWRDGGWRCRVSVLDFVPLGEGDLEMRIDRSALPEGVTMSGKDRYPDQIRAMPECHSEEVAESYVREIAEAGKAPDYARIGETYWLTKPIEWMPEPIRSALLRRHA